MNLQVMFYSLTGQINKTIIGGVFMRKVDVVVSLIELEKSIFKASNPLAEAGFDSIFELFLCQILKMQQTFYLKMCLKMFISRIYNILDPELKVKKKL